MRDFTGHKIRYNTTGQVFLVICRSEYFIDDWVVFYDQTHECYGLINLMHTEFAEEP